MREAGLTAADMRNARQVHAVATHSDSSVIKLRHMRIDLNQMCLATSVSCS